MTPKTGTSFIRMLIAVTVLTAGVGLAKSADMQVKLTGTEETPPVATSAAGVGTIAIAADKSVSGSVKTTGIDGTMAHIHVGAPGEAGPLPGLGCRARDQRRVTSTSVQPDTIAAFPAPRITARDTH